MKDDMDHVDNADYASADEAMPAEVEEVFEDFWKPIVCPEGDWDLDQVKRELHDYRVVMQGASEVYYEMTLGRISKPHTDPKVVIAVHDEVWFAEERQQLEKIEELATYYREMAGRVLEPGAPSSAPAVQRVWERTAEYIDLILSGMHDKLPFGCARNGRSDER